MKKTNTKKLAIAGVFCAVAVVGSLFSFPIFGSKCSPVQHMTNILCAVLLGTGYGLCAYPIAIFLMGQSAANIAFYAYVIPFFVSTAGGAVLSAILIYSLRKANLLRMMQESMER